MLLLCNPEVPSCKIGVFSHKFWGVDVVFLPGFTAIFVIWPRYYFHLCQYVVQLKLCFVCKLKCISLYITYCNVILFIFQGEMFLGKGLHAKHFF